ncbi:MAG: hypothetical protein CL779_02605 [Chloroflexi bacterium]|nr:hypothetical protein [Chloroflexota bacterium]
MTEDEIKAVNESSKEQGHRLRLEKNSIPKKHAIHIFGSQLNNIANYLEGELFYQTILDSNGMERKRIIIEYKDN